MANTYDGMLNYSVYQILFLICIICASSYVLLKYYIVCVLLYGLVRVINVIRDNYIVEHVDVKGRAVFITGCDTVKFDLTDTISHTQGLQCFISFTCLGNRFAGHLYERGFVVFAGCLNTKSPGALSLVKTFSKRLHLVELNATSDESVQNAFETVKKLLPKKGLWGIINNAGMNMLGDVELTPVSQYEKGFNLNMYGYIRVMKNFLPLIRQSKGRVLNVTSVRGLLAEPHQSNYHTAKHAIETLSDSLRLEMQKFGVKVSIIEPGNFAPMSAIAAAPVVERLKVEMQEMVQSAREEVRQTYTTDYLDSTLHQPIGGWPPKADSTVVARGVEHALCSGVPKERYLIQGVGSIVFFADEFVVLAWVYNIIPTWITDRYITWWKGLKKERKFFKTC